MAAPASRVFTLPVSARLGRIQDGFNSPTDSAGCFGLGFPDRLEDLQHVRRCHLSNREIAKNGINIRGERVGPLLLVLSIAPAWNAGE